MAESLQQFYLIKAISKHTGHIHYVEIDDDDYANLVEHKSEASLYGTYKAAEQAIKDYFEGEETHNYTVESIFMTFEEMMTDH